MDACLFYLISSSCRSNIYVPPNEAESWNDFLVLLLRDLTLATSGPTPGDITVCDLL